MARLPMARLRMARLPVAQGSTRGCRNALAAAAAALLAIGLAALAWKITNGPGELPAAAMLTGPVEEAPAPAAATQAVLVDIGELPASTGAKRRGRTTRRERPSPDRPSEGKPGETTASEKPAEEAPAKPAARPARERSPKNRTYPVLITPNIDVRRIPQLNLGALITLRGAAAGGGPATAHGFINNRPRLKLPGVRATSELFATLVVDHPDAMPGTEFVTPTEWGFDGVEFTCAPQVTLEPIEAKLRLGLRPDRNVRRQSGGRKSILKGTARLIQLDPSGLVLTLDSQAIGGGRVRGYQYLRYRSTSDEVLLVGIPSRENAAADVIAPGSLLAGVSSADQWNGNPDEEVQVIRLRTTPRARTLPPINFVALDPFNEPVKGATISASVIDRSIARFSQHGGPVQIDGFVFVQCGANEFTVNGQVATKNSIAPMPLGLVRRTASATSNGAGGAVIVGIPLGVHQFTVTSPFGQSAPVLSPVTSLDAGNVVRPPVVGLEVQCPLAWRADKKGRDAWARAKVKVSGQDRGLPFSKTDARSLAPRRYLIPANTACTVTCSAKGFADAVAKVRAQPGRTVQAVTPSAK